MKKIISAVATLAMTVSMFAIPQAATFADSNTINFESPIYTIGNINGQDGWTNTGAYDAAVSSSLSTTGFGSQSLRISDAVTSGSFGDQTFSKPLINEAGETDALNGGMSGGTRQSHFETQFDIVSTVPNAQQPGMHISISPDRGDGARMSYLRFEDGTNGLNVFFDDVQGTTNPATFVESQIATGLNRSIPHNVKLSMDFVDGPSNDVVKVWIDGNLVKTGTSWENYYRFDSESNPSLISNSRTVDSVLFRESGTANPADAGKGFLFDNLSLLSGPSSPTGQTCTDITLMSNTNTHFKGSTIIDPSGSSSDALFTGGTPGNAVIATPVGFPGAWDAAASDPSVAGASWVNDSATPPTNPAGPGGDGSINSWRLFSTNFTVPAGATISSSIVHFTADNSADAFLDNALVGTATDYTTIHDSALVVTPGAHELEFVVKNDAYTGETNPTGLIYKAVINYCVPTTTQIAPCPAAPAVANAYLKTLGIKPGSTQAGNIISQVAHHMGPQTQFEGSTPCEAAYVTNVKTYVDSIK